MKKKAKEVARSRKPEEKKLKHKFPVSLTDTDFKDFEEYKADEKIDENSNAGRRLLRWALEKWKAEKKQGPDSKP